MTLTDILLIVSLTISAIAGSAAVIAVLRIGALADALRPPARQSGGEGRNSYAIQELSSRIDDIANQSQTISRQLDAISLQLNELLSSDALPPTPVAPPPPRPAQGSVPVPVPDPDPDPDPDPLPAEPTPSAAPTPASMSDEVPALAPPSASTVDWSPSAGTEPHADMPADPAPPPAPPEPAPAPMSELLPSAAAEPPPTAPPSASNIARELVAGYQAAIAERSKGPIREWLAQNNSITLDISEDGQLMPSDGGPIAAIMVDKRHAILLPTAAFVVDFATRFAASQISMRQVMRNCFDSVADNSGEMRLQAPAIASRDGDRWVLDKPGRLSGFTDAS